MSSNRNTWLNVTNDYGENNDYAITSNNYIANNAGQNQFTNIPEVPLSLTKLIQAIQNEANKIADNDQPNREVHLTNGKNACNMLKQYVAISIHTQPKEFPSSRSLCFHMSKHISYVNNQSHSHDCVTHMVENNIAMSNMNDSGYEVVLFL